MDLILTLDEQSLVPLHRQLYEQLRHAILSGQLSPQQRLPSTRALATSLHVSRTTVTQCYDQLLSEGYLETRLGAGTYVCAQLPDDLHRSEPTALPSRLVQSAGEWSTYAHQLAMLNTASVAKTDMAISFQYGNPSLDHFPVKLWRSLLLHHCREQGDWLDYTQDFLGYEPLRAAIASYLTRSRAVQCDAHQVLITNGAQQALYLVARLLLNAGDAIAIEEPGYLSARHIFTAQGATLLPIEVDRSGLVVEQLAHPAMPAAKMVYVTPSHQFPTGAVLSLTRRLELLDWAGRTGAWIVEDDYDSEYRYSSRPIPALQGLDQHQSVLYVGTFSKMLFPALRIGYLVLPPALVSTFVKAKWLIDRQLSLLDQKVLTDFIQAGHLERHIRRMRLFYDQRRQVLVEAMQTELGDRVTILGDNAGIHLLGQLETQLSDAAIIQRAAEVGVGLVSACSYYLKPQRQGEFIFGYANLNERQLREGIRRLAEILTADGTP